ncbi:MAG: DUF2213 domain-containing protein [Candidatus Hydrogenedentes bacterium]|nr:DUF2213 domain-containing protein [Candidatus Hydrogenedentota bacterium]
MPEDVKRYDFMTLPGSITRTDEGFIEADPVVTRMGVFSYRMPDGTVRKEFRSDAEVFDQASLASMRMIPITNTHPNDFVTSANVGSLGVGMTGENARRDGENARVPIKVTDEGGVKAIEGGRIQLSLAYNCQVERKDGVFNGEVYTHVQRRIRYNHLALCDKARAGAQATLRLDTQDAVMVETGHKKSDSRKETKTMPDTVKLRLDSSGISYDVPVEVESEYATIRKDRDGAVTKLAAETKAKDELQGKHDALTAETEKLKKVDNGSAIAKGVKARVALVEAVRPMLSKEDAKKADEMTDAELRIAAIKATDDKFDAKDKDGKDRSEDYLAARFDAAVVTFKKLDAAKKKQGAAVVGDGSGHTDDVPDLDKLRQDMMDRQDGKMKPKDKDKE